MAREQRLARLTSEALVKDRVASAERVAASAEQAAMDGDISRTQKLVDQLAPKSRAVDGGLRKRDGSWCLSKEEEFERWSEHVGEVFDAKIIEDAVEQYEAYRRDIRDWKSWAGSVVPPAQMIMLNSYIATYIDGSAMRGKAGWAFLVYLVEGNEFTLLHAEWGPVVVNKDHVEFAGQRISPTTLLKARHGTRRTHGLRCGSRHLGPR